MLEWGEPCGIWWQRVNLVPWFQGKVEQGLEFATLTIYFVAVLASFVLSALVDRRPEFEEVQQVTVSFFSISFFLPFVIFSLFFVYFKHMNCGGGGGGGFFLACQDLGGSFFFFFFHYPPAFDLVFF